MNIKTFLQTLIGKITGSFTQAEHQLEQLLPQALHISNIIAGLLANPVTDAVLTLAVGPNAEAAIETIVKEAIKDITSVEAILALPTVDAQIRALVALIATETKARQDSLFIKIASLVLKYLDGNTKSQHIYDLVVQSGYSASKI